MLADEISRIKLLYIYERLGQFYMSKFTLAPLGLSEAKRDMPLARAVTHQTG
jgi:hypothetical protein